MLKVICLKKILRILLQAVSAKVQGATLGTEEVPGLEAL